ncbi:hypothetical protein [Desulfovirgula thermocuniculi]|uniref:hypothetical protein n=1 Tax=Desulfovirgula thermocuniculi TaxID=348842 RepID=UPI0004288DB1|nr:hypothetical protein [Desulfovirgula thermocuniculi]
MEDALILDRLAGDLLSFGGTKGFAGGALTALQGVPFLFLLVTAAHAALRGLLSPLLGRAGASLVALSATSLAVAAFSVKAAQHPALAWALVAWAANAAGAASAELFSALRKVSNGGGR